MRQLRAILLAPILAMSAAVPATRAIDDVDAGRATQAYAAVDPMIGTGGAGHVFPGATLPFGMVQLSPSNQRDGWKWTAGYHASDSIIDGFAHTHISGAGLSALGDILLMPTRLPTTAKGALDRPGSGYRSRFSHAREEAHPGYYRVHLDDPDVDAELTATPRTGFHRYRFRAAGPRYVVIDPTHAIGDFNYADGIEIVSDREVRGWRRARSQSAGDRGVWFVARFSRPFTAVLTRDDRPIAGRTARGSTIRALLRFPDTGGDTVEAAVALSHVGPGGARANFAAEAAGRGFDAVHEAARRAWTDRLARILIDEADATKRRTFYTAAYHASLAPNLISDVDGRYVVEKRTYRSARPQFSNYSSWDTFRALHPLLTIIDTANTAAFVNAMVSRHSEAGRTLPLWEAVGHDNRVMIGYAIVSPIADAVVKRVPGIDARAAYAAIRASAFDRATHSNVYDANGMDGYLRYDFVPADVAASVSKTTEQNYEDWAIGRVATMLGRTADARLFARRATGWRQLYRDGWLVPRLANGRYVPFRHDDWSDLNRHYVSGNIWAYSAFAPHDMVAAVRLHGGRAAYARWLDGIFTDQSPISGEQHVDLSGFIGRYGHGDEPGHQMAWLFNLVGAPAKTQYYVNRILREMYTDRPDGLVNNEDLGQMSAWYLLATVGLYPVAPGDPTYQIGAPLHHRASIALESGRRFTVVADKADDNAIYVQSATLNGRPLERSYLTYAEIMAGGTLSLTLGPRPSRWASAPAATSLGAFDDTARVATPQRAPWAPYDPDPAMRFPVHRAVHLRLDQPGAAIRPATGTPILTRDATIRAWSVHPALGRSIDFVKTYANSPMPPDTGITVDGPDMPYGAADGAMLIDQVRATRFYGDRKWTGRTGDIAATIDLRRPRRVASVSMGWLDDPMNGIMPPRRIEILAGDDPARLRRLAVRVIPAPRQIVQRVERPRIALPPTTHRFYRLRIAASDLPPSLSPPHRRAWLFLDEILMQ